MALTITNSNPNPNFRPPPFKNYTFNLSSSVTSSLSPSSLFHRRSLSPPISLAGVSSLRLLPHRRNLNLSFVSFAASHQDSKPSEGEIELEEDNLKQASEESQEAWEQAVESFKEHALKLQGVSQEAYEVYSKKAGVILKETAEKLKIQADQAREDLNVMAKEIGEEGRQYLTVAAENSPEPVKDVVETFASTESFDDVSKVHMEEQLYEIDIPLKFTASFGTRVHGLACWFDVLFNGRTVQRWLTTAPGSPTTHWYQLRCVLSQPIYVMAGQEITGRLHMVAHNAQSYTLNLTLSVLSFFPLPTRSLRACVRVRACVRIPFSWILC